MKIFKLIFPIAIVGILAACASQPEAREIAAEKVVQAPTTNDRDTKFLVEMADERLLETQAGQIAFEKAHSKAVRTYAHDLMKNQIHIMTGLTDSASAEKIILPDRVSDSKADALNDLRNKKGKEFDRKFITMTKRDLELDIKAFMAAMDESSGYSAQVQDFAKKNLPALETDLEQIIELEKAE